MFRVGSITALKRSFYSLRSLSYSKRAYNYQSIPRSRVPFSVLIGLACLSGYSYSTLSSDSKKDIENTVSVDKSIDPFPTHLNNKGNSLSSSEFQLLGYGVRSVTFLNFKVYGIGLYIANDDINIAKNVLHRVQNVSSLSLKDSLLDPVESSLIIEQLIDEGVRFAVRISPVRNTDFNHLRDGLIKSILAHPKSKEVRESVSSGLDELRNAFSGRKGSVPKNHVLYLECLPSKRLKVAYFNPDKDTGVIMGTVNNPIVSKLLFLQYLSGKKPLSEPLRQSCVDGFLGL
ncbi:uncharacterized protein PRCAT00004478001 [Priceomyces carsonii]|uniref:uncharacterized protein n=1 Tax=Priceomyces carsonii TaxID=28549 RepID=UPI002EDA9945|nr:unnamed protein product [Priceomyces carsonii]